ncbi:glycosyltransferase [Neobacillus sp. D3-1R]|uniref:glycosyltransferase n=1 Tax=Neobacillus sp. D3-1R TaxID=3445778 RepID=UPI003F9F16E9
MEVLHCFGLMHRGGAETMLMNLYRNIDKSKYKFNFLVHSNEKGDYDDEIKKLGGEIFYTKSLGDVGLIKYVLQFREIISKMPKIDIVHIHMDWQSGFIALAAYLAGIKNIVVHSHTHGLNKPSKKKQIAVFCSRKLISRYAKERFACSKEAANYLYENEHYQILNNAIDFSCFQEWKENSREETRIELGLLDTDKVLCHIGRLSDNKNQLFLLKLLQELLKEDKSYKLILIGRGEEYHRKISKYVTENNLANHVQLLGVKEDIPKFLHASNLFLFPSKREGFGMVAVEAQLASLPCIISDSVPKKVDLGLELVQFLPLDESDQWILAIKNAQKQYIDKRVLASALEANHFDIATQVNMLEGAYKNLIIKS